MTRILILFAFLTFVPTAARADGVLDLLWDGCTGPVTKTILPGTFHRVYASEFGHTSTHYGYDLRIRLTTWCGQGSPSAALTDAWRFDATGCQGSDFILIDHLTVDGPFRCPSFQGPIASVQTKQFQFDPLTGQAQVILVNSYPGGSPPINLGFRKYLVAILFDHTLSVPGATTPGISCGGLSTPVCLSIAKAAWLDAEGNENAFALGNSCVTANDPNEVTGCTGSTPVRARSWGAIKDFYR
jgi:hypothetical protein